VEITYGTLWLRELKQGEAAMLHADERMKLNAQLSAAEARAGAAKKRLNAAMNAPLEATGGATLAALAGKTAGGTSAFEEHFREALNNPEFKKRLADAQKARLGQEYGPLFAQLGQLGLSPDQLSKFQGLLVDKQLAKSEAGPLDVYDTQMEALLGDKAYQAYVQYEDTALMRSAVAKIAAGLSATDAPLPAGAADKLVDSWYAALPAESKGHPTGPSAEVGAGLVASYELPVLPANSAQIAQGILSAPQLAAFQRLIDAQTAQQRLRAEQ